MIRLSKLADYAVVVLGQMSHDGQTLTASQLADRSSVPLPTVAKILKLMARGGVVTSHRGAAGGYNLSRPAEAITVAQIIQALDGPISITACVDGAEGHCEAEGLCPMRGNWDRVNRAIRGALESISLAEMVALPAFPAVAAGTVASYAR